MIPVRVWLTLGCLSAVAACGGGSDSLQNGAACGQLPPPVPGAAQTTASPAAPEPAQIDEPVASPADAGAAPAPTAQAGAPAQPMMQPMQPPATNAPPPKTNPKPDTKPQQPVDTTPSIGTGDLTRPAHGPAPLEAAKLAGAPYTLVKNWDFGTRGTVRNQIDLDGEFQYHDVFGTIANGTNYGAVTVASTLQAAIDALGLGLDNNRQPVEDPANPYREFTSDSLLTYVRPLEAKQSKCKVSKHNAGNGSFTSKWRLEHGGALLGRDLVWETRARMPKPLPGYWFALWTAGTQWDSGAEMDVMESFGTPNISADAFHADAVGGTGTIDYASWPNGLTAAGVPLDDRKLSDWHVWTWVYLRDDSYEVYYDGHRVQSGKIHWSLGGLPSSAPIDMRFLFDFSWGHTQVKDVDIELPAKEFPIIYEVDYSRVYMR
jgi:hypothetical protein